MSVRPPPTRLPRAAPQAPEREFRQSRRPLLLSRFVSRGPLPLQQSPPFALVSLPCLGRRPPSMQSHTDLRPVRLPIQESRKAGAVALVLATVCIKRPSRVVRPGWVSSRARLGPASGVESTQAMGMGVLKMVPQASTPLPCVRGSGSWARRTTCGADWGVATLANTASSRWSARPTRATLQTWPALGFLEDS